MEPDISCTVDKPDSYQSDRHRESCSSQSTASIKDILEEVDTHTNESATTATIEDDNCSCSGSDSTSRCTNMPTDKNMMDWTKKFNSLVDEAPFMQATIISDSALQNGISVAKKATKEYGENVENGSEKKTPECDWVDLDLLEEGRRFVRKHFFAVFLANLIGIAFLLTVRPIQALLLRTSSLHNKENSMKRFARLMLYLKRFYQEPNILIHSTTSTNQAVPNATSSHQCRNDISFIQGLERNAARNFKVYVPPPWEDIRLSGDEQEVYNAVREDTKQLDGFSTNTKYMPKILFTVNPDLPMSQYDLVIIQYVFFGLITKYPQIFGIHGQCDPGGNPKGLKGYIHLWAVLGHVFGIEEKFNLCIPQNYDPETNQLIFKQVLLFSLQTANEAAMRLWRSMTSKSSKYFFFFRTKAMLLFMCKDVAQLDNCKYLYSVMKPVERFCYYFYKFLVTWVLWVPPLRVVINFSLLCSIRICQYFLSRAKKCESKWDTAPFSICVIEPSLYTTKI